MPPIGFLSSLTKAHWALRERIHTAAARYGGIYVDEQDHPRKFPLADPLEAVDELIEQIRQSELFVCLLARPDHGSPIEGSLVSYFEVELYQAALLQKPTLMIAFDGFTPGPELAEVLRLFQSAFPSSSWRIVNNEQQAIDAISQGLTSVQKRFRICIGRGDRRRFVTELWRARAAQQELTGHETPTRFLEPRRGSGRLPRVDEVNKWMDRAATQQDQQRRLARLWVAFKELSVAPWDDPANSVYLPLWSKLMAEWTRAAAWYGLHGHMPLGRLAAAKTLKDIDVRSQGSRLASGDADAEGPAGALASAHYSVAKLLLDKSGQAWHFRESMAQVNDALKLNSDSDGLFAIRGSIHLQLGETSSAIADYNRVLILRQKRSASNNSIGEALSELGFGYVRGGQILKGRRLIEDGLRLLDDQALGFRLRAERKLAVAQFATGRWIRAFKTLTAARSRARAANLRDQDKLT
jgi:tetratricopeptide (TPR) repeat protein